MFRRLFFALLGLGAGLILGIWAIRKLEAAQRALAPDQIARAAGSRAEATRTRLADAVAAGRAAAAAREAELREQFGPGDPRGLRGPAQPGGHRPEPTGA